MGNCMRASRSKRLEEEEFEAEIPEEATKFNKGNDDVGKGTVKVKIVLTKEELALFLLKLKDSKGGKSLEELLAEMEKARSGKVDSWRPSLESIMEDDDDSSNGLVLDMNRS